MNGLGFPRKLRDWLQLAVEGAELGLWHWDERTTELEWDLNTRKMFGAPSHGKVKLQTFVDALHPDDRDRVMLRWRHCIENRLPYAIDLRAQGRDGSIRWIHARGKAYYGVDATPLAMVGVVFDITERKRFEESIKQSEDRYRRIVETTNEGVWLLDSHFRNVYVNRQMAEMLGYEPAEMIGQSVFEFYFPEDFEHKKQILTRQKEGMREQLEERFRRKDGSELWARISATSLLRNNGEFDGALAMVSDVTARKRAEDALRESEETFRSVFQEAGVGMVIVSLEGRFLAANRTFCNCLGYSEEELLAKTVESLTHPDDWPAFSAQMKQALIEGHGFQWIEKRCLRKDGRIIHTESSASVIRGSVDGAPKYLVGEVLDVTKRKEAERALAAMTQQLIQAQEQERTRIARELHDNVSQQLAMLAIELDQWHASVPADTDFHDRLHRAKGRIVEIGNDVQAVSHQLHTSKLEYLGAIAGMKSWCREVADRYKVEVAFKSDFSGNVPLDLGLPLFRVLQEAVTNAIKHSGGKRIEVQLREVSGEIHLIVRDSGKGFDAETALRGQGLGLTSMRERVRLVNGTIAIDSRPVAGTTIRVRVPLRSQTFSQRLVS